MNQMMEEKFASIVVGRDEATDQMFRCIIYSNNLEPTYFIERVITNPEDLRKILNIMEDRKFSCEVIFKTMNPSEWESKKEELLTEAKQHVEKAEKEQSEIKKAYNEKIAKVEKKSKVKNLKVWGITALTIAAIAIGGYALQKDKPNTVTAPDLSSSPAITAPVTPGNTIDERIEAMKDQFAKGELYYDITNPDEVEKRVNTFITYFDKMKNSSITKSEVADFYLLINGIKPSEGVNIDELMRKIQSASAFDPYFDWREVAGQEIIANKRDSAYLDIYLRAINDWKAAAESHNMKQVTSMGKELVATSYYGLIMRDPLKTQVQEIGSVNLQNVSPEIQAFITGYVGLTLNYPGYDIMEAIGPVTIQGETINVNHVAEPLAGPHVIPAGEQASTQNGGSQGFAQATMITVINKYNNGEYPLCPKEIEAALNSLKNQPVKTLK